MSERFVVKVGQKKIWSYVTACITHFNSGGKQVLIRGRGSSAYKAVEIANALKISFMKNIIFEQISIVEDELFYGDRKVIIPVLEVLVSLPSNK